MTIRMTIPRFPLALLLLTVTTITPIHAFTSPAVYNHYQTFKTTTSTTLQNGDWTSDFDDFAIDEEEEDTFSINKILARTNDDSSACRVRQFSLGQDLVLTDYVGNMGFDAVTDWEYYYRDEDTGDKRVVPPPPLDPSKPKRTRESSGSVVRLFRGEFQGRLGPTLQSQGLDRRCIIKEFTGTLALDLARSELASVSKLQSSLVKDDDWVQTALSRSVLTRRDDSNIRTLLAAFQKSPFLGILGQVNLAELEEDDGMDPNEFYRALGVKPPEPGAVWIVYEYAGLSTVASAYSQPAAVRASNLPVRRGLFGNPIPPQSLPPWKDRARYVVRGIIAQALQALAQLHEQGIAHRSIGRSSILIGSVGMDKREASSPYATNLSRLVVKLADFGFSSSFEESTTRDDNFLSRARSFGLQLKETDSSAIKGYAMAEDLHALGVVILGLLLSSLAEPPTPDYVIPATDEDTLQRLLTDIFDKDVEQFREYVEAEEVWTNVVELLDEKDGWEFLEALLFARERAAKDGELLTARGLLSSPFLQP